MQTGTRPVRYLDVLFDDVEVEKDIQYKEAVDYKGEKVKLKLDVYQPLGDSEKNRPAIIWVHGGDFREGSKDNKSYIESDLAYIFAQYGYVTLSIDYRLRPIPESDFMGTITDVMSDAASAADWLAANSKKYGVNPGKIALGGYSAGAEAVLNLNYSSTIKDWKRENIFAVIDISGNTIYDTIPENAPPCIIVHGSKDEINPFPDSEAVYERLKKAKVDCKLVTIDNVGHDLSGNFNEVEKAISDFLAYQLKEN